MFGRDCFGGSLFGVEVLDLDCLVFDLGLEVSRTRFPGFFWPGMVDAGSGRGKSRW